MNKYALRKNHEQLKSNTILYNALLNGIESGISNKNVDSIWNKAVSIHNKNS